MTSLLLTWILLGQTTPIEAHVVKTFYLSDRTSSQRLSEIMTILRQRLNLRYLIMNTGVTGIAVRDTPERVAQAENLVAQFELPASSTAVAVDGEGTRDQVHIVQTFYLSDSATQLDLVEIVTALRTLLNTRYVAMNRNAKAIAIRDSRSQVTLAAKVIADLDRSLRGRAGVPASALIEAGQPSEIDRRDALGPERQISLTNVQTEAGINEIVNALRTLLNIVPVEARGNTIVLRGTENNVVVAEKIVADLDKPSRR